MRAARGCLFRTCYSRGISHCHLYLAEAQRQMRTRGVEKLYDRKKERVRYVPYGGCRHQEAGGRLTRNGASYAIGLGSTFGFLWLVLSWKWRRNKESWWLQAKS